MCFLAFALLSQTAFSVLQNAFSPGGGSAGQGGRGDSDLPPMPPWTPYTPFKRPRDTPGKGYVPLSLDRQGPYRARHLVWPWASNQSGAGVGTHFAWPRCRGASRCKMVLPWRSLADTPGINRCRGAGGGISCAVGDSGPPRDGREPSWVRPCEASGALFLSNGGSGGGHETCTLWPPPAPFGYFPVWESTSSAAGGRNLPQEAVFLRKAGKRAFLAFSRITKGFASAEATRGLSARPLDPFGGPPIAGGRNLPQGTDFLHKATERAYPTFPVSQKVSPLRRRPKGFPIALWKPSDPIPVEVLA